MKFFLVLLTSFIVGSSVPYADTGPPQEQAPELLQFDTPEAKARFYQLLKELRCLVCQNQSLADSAAGLAQDLRDEVEIMVRAGKSDEEIVQFMVARYGDFVLYNPPLKKSTILLWFSPFIFAGLAIVAFVWFMLQRSDNKLDGKINEVRRKRAALLLKNQQNDELNKPDQET